jgi:hypothetical protein
MSSASACPSPTPSALPSALEFRRHWFPGWSTNGPLRALPKIGESRDILWDFVDLSLCKVVPFLEFQKLTAFVSINCASLLWKSHRWHVVCSLSAYSKDWLPGVAGTDPRLGYRFWGVNYKKGACTSPLFHFPAYTSELPSYPCNSTGWPSAARSASPAFPAAGICRRSGKPNPCADGKVLTIQGIVFLAAKK